MVFVPPKDRVLETSNSNSQTVFALNGAVDTSYNPFSASMSVGDTTTGAVVEPGVAFRSGTLTYSAANQITVSRTTESKGTFSSSGTKEVFMGEPAALRGDSTGPIIVLEGDSLSASYNIAAQSAYFARGTFFNFAAGGDTAAAMVSEYATEAGAVTISPGAEAYFFFWAGTNDIAASVAGVPSAATIYGYLTTIWAAARASGYKVVAFTIMPRGTYDATQEGIRLALNALITSDLTLYDYLVRPDRFLSRIDTENFQSDTIHLTTLGDVYLAKQIVAAVLGVQSVPAAPFDALAYNGLQPNGSCDIDQEHSAGLTAAINGYAIDGWKVEKSGTMVLAAQQVADAPPGLTNSLKVTVTTAQAVLGSTDFAHVQVPIEGYQSARLKFGATGAQSVSLGFWTKHHRAGLYGGSIRNSANTRSIIFSYTQAVADTWQFNTATLLGDTTGTWIGSTSGVGLRAYFGIGLGSSFLGAPGVWATAGLTGPTSAVNGVAALTDTFQITGLIVIPGVDLPSAQQAALIMRPYDLELPRCKRYLQMDEDGYNFLAGTANAAGTFITNEVPLVPSMRAAPSVSFPTIIGYTNASALAYQDGTRNWTCFSLAATAAGFWRVYALIKYDARLS